MANNTGDEKNLREQKNGNKQEELMEDLRSQVVGGSKKASPIHPGQERLQCILTELESVTRQQQLERGQALQNTLCQATTTLEDARRVDTMENLVAELAEKLASPSYSADPGPFLQVIGQLEDQVQKLLQEADCQIAQSMQQAVSALAQSQATMLVSQNYSQIQQLLQDCKNTLQEQWPQAENIH
ncbi:MAG: hypothetical protein GX349_05555 [Firmicutes bacterium]|nr:hypothetical protein [Bacillota bacterium]